MNTTGNFLSRKQSKSRSLHMHKVKPTHRSNMSVSLFGGTVKIHDTPYIYSLGNITRLNKALIIKKFSNIHRGNS